MLDGALRAGIYLPYACNHGLCGTCKVTVLGGEVAHGQASSFALMDVERDEGRTLACCATLLSDVTIEADVDEEPDAERLPVADYRAQVSRIEDRTPTIKAVFLTLDDAELHFQAGQYLNLVIPGLDGPRAFSIASAPSSRREIELHVRKVEGGAGTAYVHERLEPGDELRFTAPLGRFFVRKSAPEPVLLLAHPDPAVLCRARDAVRFDVDPLPAVLSIEAAEAPGAPIIWGQDNLLYRLSNLGTNGHGGFLVPKGGMGSVAQALPEVVNRMTPNGNVPQDSNDLVSQTLAELMRGRR